MAVAADDAIHPCLARCLELGVVKAADQATSAPGAQGQRAGARQVELPAQMLLLEAMQETNGKFFAAVELHRLAVELVAVGHEQLLAVEARVGQLFADPAASRRGIKPLAQRLFMVAQEPHQLASALALQQPLQHLPLGLRKLRLALLPAGEIQDVAHQHHPLAGLLLQQRQQGAGAGAASAEMQITEKQAAMRQAHRQWSFQHTSGLRP